MSIINFDDFKKGGFVVNCRDEESAKRFLELCEEKGIRVAKDAYDDAFDRYKEELCYSCCNNAIFYANVEFYVNEQRREVEVFNHKTLKPMDILKNTKWAVAEIRRGERYVYFADKLLNDDGWLDIGEYDEELFVLPLNYWDTYGEDDFDIVKIYTVDNKEIYNIDDILRFKSNLKLVWERKIVKKMTLEEIEKELGYKIKLIDVEVD